MVGFIGLGKMGKNMVLHLLEGGEEVVVWNRSPEPVDEVVKAGAIEAGNLQVLSSKLQAPRTVWLMLPSGEVTDEFIQKLVPLLAKGDLIIDGANSFYKDSIRRAGELSKKGIHFMDVGVSGGPTGARSGGCLMVGGEVEDYQKVEALLKKIAAPGALGYFGRVGAGHFAKMVHNGIEYGMMQSIAEGLAVLKKSDFNFDLEEVLRVYNSGSVIQSRLVGWAAEALKEDPNLTEVSSKIGATGEGEWTIKTARELGLKVPVIEDSFKFRQNSSESSGDFTAKVVSALRGKFGGHLVKKF